MHKGMYAMDADKVDHENLLNEENWGLNGISYNIMNDDAQ